MAVFTKQEFKELWELDDGGGITFSDIADCAKAWGICPNPRTMPVYSVGNKVLVAAGLEPFFPENENEE